VGLESARVDKPDIQVFPDPAALAAAAAPHVVDAANEAIALTDRFAIALSGGSTPKALHGFLADEPLRSRIDWSKVEIFFGDERCVPPDHPDSNYRMAAETLLSKVPIPGDNIYRMRGEIDPNEAAKEYGRMLKEKFGHDGGLDLVLLGLGEDGHTLSLFPGTPAVEETHHRCVANYAEHSTTGKSWRITLTAPLVNRSREAMFLVAGAAKVKALSAVLEGPRDPGQWPAQLIQPVAGRLIWLIDAAAAGMNE
jgi:6-phosphogluconolactonase